MTKQARFKIKNIKDAKNQLLNFSELFDICNIYDSNEIKTPLDYGRFEVLVAFGCLQKIEGNFRQITNQIKKCNQWIFGYMGYESYLKFDSKDKMNTCETYFYLPKFIASISLGKNQLVFENNGIPDSEFKYLLDAFKTISVATDNKNPNQFSFKPLTKKGNYLKNIEHIKNNIVEGDYYEINYCQKFQHKGKLKNPLAAFNAINLKSPTPFAAYIKNEHYHILCTSPERFVYRNDNALVSQPIKGTNKRIQGEANKKQLKALKTDEKEIAENVMIVDLVRNDMAKICNSGTIDVKELCGTYPFALVNQMISTVSGVLKKNIHFADILRALFPMGSMTGAPKIEVMKNIRFYEDTSRGIYSGCAGYIMPNGNFDFNVIIRTLIEDKNKEVVSFHAGGAITYDSVAKKEYEECMLKAKGLFEF